MSGRDVLGNVEVMQLDFEMENFTSLSVTRRINWNIDYKGQNPPPDSEKVVTELTVVQRDIQAIIPLAMVSGEGGQIFMDMISTKLTSIISINMSASGFGNRRQINELSGCIMTRFAVEAISRSDLTLASCHVTRVKKKNQPVGRLRGPAGLVVYSGRTSLKDQA